MNKLIEEQRKQFNEQSPCSTKDCDNNGTYPTLSADGMGADPNKCRECFEGRFPIFNWHIQSIIKFIDSEIERLKEKRDSPPPYNADPNNPMKHVYKNEGYNQAIADQISHLENIAVERIINLINSK